MDNLARAVAGMSESPHAFRFHLERWVQRNSEWEWPSPGAASGRDEWTWGTVKSLTRWAYDRAFDLGLPTWVRRRETAPLSPGYARFLQ